jgi:hypothetical protein
MWRGESWGWLSTLAISEEADTGSQNRVY